MRLQKLIYLLILIFSWFFANAQEVIFTNEGTPKNAFNNMLPAYFGEKIDGAIIYKGKGGVKIPFAFNIEQFNCLHMSDVEAEFKLLKGSKDAQMGIMAYLFITSNQLLKPRFYFTPAGDWFLDELVQNKRIANGKCEVNPDFNTVMISHRVDKVIFKLNGKEITTYQTSSPYYMSWASTEISTNESVKELGLKRVKVTGYHHELNDPVSNNNFGYASPYYGLHVGNTSFYKVSYEKSEYAADSRRFRLMDKTGKFLSEEYKNIGSENSNDSEIQYEKTGSLFRVFENNPPRYGYIDRTGKLVVPLHYAEATFDPISVPDSASFGLYRVKDINGKTLYLDSLGRITIPSPSKKVVKNEEIASRRTGTKDFMAKEVYDIYTTFIKDARENQEMVFKMLGSFLEKDGNGNFVNQPAWKSQGYFIKQEIDKFSKRISLHQTNLDLLGIRQGENDLHDLSKKYMSSLQTWLSYATDFIEKGKHSEITSDLVKAYETLEDATNAVGVYEDKIIKLMPNYRTRNGL